jgi:hypothetical protein
MLEAFFVGKHDAEGSTRHKKPPPSHNLPEGVSATHRLDTYPHGALTSMEAYPLQRSSLQGLLPYGSSYHEALGLHTHY